MAKITSLTAEEQNVLSRLGKKLPKELTRQDRGTSSPAKEQKPPKAKTGNTSPSASASGGDQSPGGVMGHKAKSTPVKITAKKADKRS